MSEQKLIQSISIPKKIKYAFKGVQLISKSTTAKLALKLFQKPINFKRPKREQNMWDSAQKKRIKINILNTEIDVLSYGYSAKKVLLVHGWSGRSTQLFMVADKLLENGYMIISFDAPAHGNSEGKFTSMPEFIDCIYQLNEEFGPFDAAIGHSFGGTSLYNAYKKEYFPLKTLVTISAADLISDVIKNFTKNLGLNSIIATKMKAHYDALLTYDVDNHSSSEKAKEIKIPTLVVHDTLDGDVAVSCAKNIRQSLQNGSLLITKGLGHTKILRDKETMDKIVKFIKQNQ